MTLSNKPYKALDAIWLTFRVSPICAALNIFLTIVHAVLPTAAMALATANFVDTATAILDGTRLREDIYLPLVLLLVVLGAFTANGAIIVLVRARIRLNLERKLKPAIVEIRAALDYMHIENAKSWELISRVSRDPVMSVIYGKNSFLQIILLTVSISSILALIVAQVWWAAFIIVAFSAPMFWLSMRAGKKNYQASRDAEKYNRRTEYLSEVLTDRDNAEERTLFNYGEKVNKHWHEHYEKGRVLEMKVQAKMFMVVKGSSILLAVVGLLIALTLIGPVIAGSLSAGMFMGILSAVFGMINQLGWKMSSAVDNISRVSEYMKDLTALISLSQSDGVLDEPVAEPEDFHSLEFRNVRFRYPSGGIYVLNGLSFSLNAGKHYAFVGKNGAGKTTITKLLTGLYSGYEGEIFVNGKELRTYPACAIKALFSVVYQDFAKYNIPLKDNIAIGDICGNDNEKRIPDAARQAGLGELISGLKDGINTPLGRIKAGGQDISGGQWQKVAIARSLISRAPVKMLDEPTAALDPISESRVYEEFEKLMRGKTTVFISHRLGSTKLADEILVIDNGQIAERGTHSELMAIGGQYAEMYESQRSWYQ